MLKRVAIDFACNDPDNGIFAGQVFLAEYGEAELEPPFSGGFRFTEGDGWIRIHRRKFEFVGSRDWVGNWCWNRYWFNRSVAKRLLGVMRANGWRCTTGPVHMYNWWNRASERASPQEVAA